MADDDILPGAFPDLRYRQSPGGSQHMYREDEPPDVPALEPSQPPIAGRPPAIEEVMDAYIRQFRVPDEPAEEPAGGQRVLASGGRATRQVAGKKGTADEGLDFYSPIPGQVMQTEQGFLIHDPTGQTPDRPYTARHAYNPKTGQIYEEVLEDYDRATFLPLSGQRSTGAISPAVPGVIMSGLHAIGKAGERQRLGLVVPDSVMAREAMEVAGFITSGAPAIPTMVREVARARPGATTAVEAPEVGRRGGVTIGMGGGDLPVAPGRPPTDPTGLYSRAQRAATALPQRSTGEDVLGIMTGPRGRVSEAEIQAMGLDEFLLGRSAAGARRDMMAATDRVAAAQKEIKELRENLARFNAHKTPSTPTLLPDAYTRELAAAEGKQQAAQMTVESSSRMYDIYRGITRDDKGRVTGRNKPKPVTRQEVEDFINQNRLRTIEHVFEASRYQPRVEAAIDHLSSPQGLQEFREHLSRNGVPTPTAHALSEILEEKFNSTLLKPGTLVGFLATLVGHAFDPLKPKVEKALTHVLKMPWREVGHARRLNDNSPRASYSFMTIDPKNRTIKEIVQRVDNPKIAEARDLILSIPNAQERRTLMEAWGWTIQQIKDRFPITQGDGRAIQALRDKHKDVIEKLLKLEREHGVFIGGHFPERPNAYAFAMTSVVQNPQGRPALFLSQLQSDWTILMQQGRTSARNVMSSALVHWVDAGLRRVIKEAVDSGAESIIIPTGRTVNEYNKISPATRKLYDDVFASRLYAVMREYDRAVQRPQPVTSITRSDGTQYTFPSIVRRGELNLIGVEMPLTPAIRERFQGPNPPGMRLLAGADDPRSAAIVAGVTGAQSTQDRSIASIVDPARLAARAADPESLPRRIRRVQPTETEMRNYPRAERIDILEPNDAHPGPIVAFHTSHNNFTAFDLSRSNDIGHHFGNRVQANNIGTSTPGLGEGARVIPAYLDVHRPLTLPDLGGWNPNRVAYAILDAVSTRHTREANNLLDTIERGGLSRLEQYVAIRSALTDMGYDSIRYQNTYEGSGWSYIVWQPGRVRSVTDPSHQLYARGAPVPQQQEGQDGPQVRP